MRLYETKIRFIYVFLLEHLKNMSSGYPYDVQPKFVSIMCNVSRSLNDDISSLEEDWMIGNVILFCYKSFRECYFVFYIKTFFLMQQ